MRDHENTTVSVWFWLFLMINGVPKMGLLLREQKSCSSLAGILWCIYNSGTIRYSLVGHGNATAGVLLLLLLLLFIDLLMSPRKGTSTRNVIEGLFQAKLFVQYRTNVFVLVELVQQI